MKRGITELQYTNTLIQKSITIFSLIGNVEVCPFPNLSPMSGAIFFKKHQLHNVLFKIRVQLKRVDPFASHFLLK